MSDNLNLEQSGACAMAEATSGSTTVTVVAEELTDSATTPILKLRLKTKSEDKKKVAWTEETVDNEHLNRKKSKCCCVYVKPKAFGESDSESDSSDMECEHCTGHVEAKK